MKSNQNKATWKNAGAGDTIGRPKQNIKAEAAPARAGVKLCDLPASEFELGGEFDKLCRESGFASGKQAANDLNLWTLTVKEARETVCPIPSAPAQAGSWKVTEELDAIQCPICNGYNRLSISSNRLYVYCAECGDTISETYLATQSFNLARALEREAAPAQAGGHTPGPWHVTGLDYIETGGGATGRRLGITGGVEQICSRYVIGSQAAHVCTVDRGGLAAQADSRLISSAPALLAALQGSLAILDKHPADLSMWIETETGQLSLKAARNEARAAIAQVEGGAL